MSWDEEELAAEIGELFGEAQVVFEDRAIRSQAPRLNALERLQALDEELKRTDARKWTIEMRLRVRKCLAKVRRNPIRLQQYLEMWRKRDARKYAAIKAEPKRWAEYAAKQAERRRTRLKKPEYREYLRAKSERDYARCRADPDLWARAKASSRSYYARNADKARAKARDHYWRNVERLRAKARAYGVANRELINSKARARYYATKADPKKWAEHQERQRAARAKRKTRRPQ